MRQSRQPFAGTCGDWELRLLRVFFLRGITDGNGRKWEIHQVF